MRSQNDYELVDSDLTQRIRQPPNVRNVGYGNRALVPHLAERPDPRPVTGCEDDCGGDRHVVFSYSTGTVYERRTGSSVTSRRPCASAWQTSILSNGSLWCNGSEASLPTLASSKSRQVKKCRW